MDTTDVIQWSPGITLESIEKQVILRAFRHYRGNKTTTAIALGIAIRTLDNKLEKYELDAKNERAREEHAAKSRAEWLTRSRGIHTPDNVSTSASLALQDKERAKGDVQTTAGFRVEPALGAPAQPVVPVPQRKEVQGVLPQHAAKSGSRQNR